MKINKNNKMKMKLYLTPEQLKTVEGALNELFNSDIWIAGRKEGDIDKDDIIDKIAAGHGYLYETPTGYLLHVTEPTIKKNKNK